jgi:AcrR family transcriptional regulator
MPRRTAAETRHRLLDAGAKLLERHGAADVTLERVADAAGVTRQAVYLHFGSRGRFLADVVEHIGANDIFATAGAIVRDAPDGEAALRGLIELRARRSRRAYQVTTAFNSAIHADADAARIWKERQVRRLALFREVARRLEAEGRLRDDLTVSDAAALMWSTVSFESWHYLGETNGWSARRFTKRIHALLMRGLTNPEPAE